MDSTYKYIACAELVGQPYNLTMSFGEIHLSLWRDIIENFRNSPWRIIPQDAGDSMENFCTAYRVIRFWVVINLNEMEDDQ